MFERDYLAYLQGKVNDAHAQRIIGTGVVIIPPHEFKQLFCCNYSVQKVKVCEFAVVTNDITTITNFINFRPSIL
jgi:hypothetical protein